MVVIDGKEIVLNLGDELFVSKGTAHSERCKAVTLTILTFGGQRIK